MTTTHIVEKKKKKLGSPRNIIPKIQAYIIEFLLYSYNHSGRYDLIML
jgi:hypothetical protein